MRYSRGYIRFYIKILVWMSRFNGWWQGKNVRQSKLRGESLKAKVLTNYFSQRYIPAIERLTPQESSAETPETVWQFWDNPTGKTTPAIVRAAIESVEKFKGSWKHRILTLENFTHETDLPDCVLDKFGKGKMSFMHFADLLRLNLLKNHGGIWLDATAYMTGYVPQHLLDEDFFVFLTGQLTHFPYSFMQNCFIRARKGSFLCAAWYQMCMEFWKCEPKALDYFQHQLIFKTLVEKNPIAAALFGRMPQISEDQIQCLISDNLLKKFDVSEWEKIKQKSFFQKTTYKVPELIGSDSYFSKLCEGKI